MPAAEARAAAPQARHPLVERVLAPGTPESIRMGAARGALPIPQQDLIYLQVCLLADPSAAITAAARESLGRISIETILPLLRDPDCESPVLDHFALSGRLKGDTLAAAIAHPALDASALVSLAATAGTETLALIVTNEIRIIADPALLAALRGNPQLSGELRRRLAELERDFIGRDPIRVGTAQPAAPEAPAVPESELVDAVAEGTAPETPEGEAEYTEPAPAAEPEIHVDEEVRKTDAYQRIMQMNVAERHLLAMKGSSEERAILVRDTARTVAMAVIKNPRLSENEITTFSSMRNVHEDILRVIASSREWTKSYTVAHALVRNPKTPSGLSIQFLARLGTRDLKIVTADKNVPEMVRRQARILFLARTQPAKKAFKKAH